MSRSIQSNARARSWFGLALLALALGANAGELYQWKDAQGVTHYADSPPADAPYKNRSVRDSGAASANARPTESAQCMTARLNLQHLQGTGPVGFDADNDGTPDATFTGEQRTAQTEKAAAAVATHCVPAAAEAD